MAVHFWCQPMRFVLSIISANIISLISQLPPYIMYDKNVQKELALMGTFIFALNAVCHSLHHRCKLLFLKSSTLANESLNGVYGDLTYGKAQIGLAAMSLIPERQNGFEIIMSPFTRSYEVFIDSSHIFTSRGDAAILALAKNYTPIVWVIFFVLLLTILIGVISFGVVHQVIRKQPFKLLKVTDVWGTKMFASVVNCCKETNTYTHKRSVSAISSSSESPYRLFVKTSERIFHNLPLRLFIQVIWICQDHTNVSTPR